MTLARFHFLNRVTFGAGAAETLPGELAAADIRRPLLVSDAGLVATGLVDRLRDSIAGPTCLFDAVPPNPTEAAVLAARALYLAEGCDGIVAIGGGSPLDFAKAVALLATHPLPLERYAALHGGTPRIGPCAPVIAVPTTAGTGSEVGRGALITLASGPKLVFASPQLLPVVALCDPALTVSLPPLLTAATGMDALSHCIESYLSPLYNPAVDAIVLDGARRAWGAIRTATAEPGNLGARTDMMMASIEGGLGFQKGLGAVHALSHPLGALQSLSLHHGSCNAAILPAVLRFNAPAAAGRIAELHRALGLPAGTGLAEAVARLNADLGLPLSLRDMGVTAAMIPGLTQGALADHSRPTNPRPLGDADILALYSELVA
ncbi:iron-containing alcohol dehydrogenase (plasmid) [Paroceanicella profunda]|uniref:Iron-containing alcohol dehydrogenase n=1 Tax=Paroceanicella profunda TaxID=2579971 RepID=A0A5B8FZ79_9RHOB|nr:iron-containing alcohol dehydrogenase [Paroceanicella profunda]QDL94216.1 iron-containing alcohol dehydrogenase [Paroceanicella profunda]